jgi:hypothetical protein
MKTKIYLMLLAGTIVTACSDDNSLTTNAPVTELTLQRVEKFTPSVEAYQAGDYPSCKNVQYFENGHIIADTTFNYQHHADEITRHVYTGTTHTQSFEHSGVVNMIKEKIYDGLGRLIQINTSWPNAYINGTPIIIMRYSYTNDAITLINYDGTTGEILGPVVTYSLNSNGHLSGYVRSNGETYDTIVYDGNKPLRALNDFGTVNFTYYPVAVPENMQKTAIETNNAMLDGTGFNDFAALNCSYFLKSYDGHATFETVFNNLNYPTHTKGSGSLHETPYTDETFYFYNE